MNNAKLNRSPKHTHNNCLTTQHKFDNNSLLAAGATAARTSVSVAVLKDTRASPELRTVGSPATLLEVDGLERVEAQGVLGDRVGDALGVEQVSLVVEVVDVVARQVVVLVVRLAGLAAEQLCLLLRLDNLGAGKETAGGDAVLDEGGVVGAAAELGGYERGVVARVELLKLLLNLGRAGGAGQVECAAVAVVDAVDVVGAGNLFPIPSLVFKEVVA